MKYITTSMQGRAIEEAKRQRFAGRPIFEITLVARIVAPTAADAKEAIADVVARVAHVTRFEVSAEQVRS